MTVERTDHAGGGATGHFILDADKSADKAVMLELVRAKFPHISGLESQDVEYIRALHDLALATQKVDPTHVGKDKLRRERERQRQQNRGDGRDALEARARKILGPQARFDGESDRQVCERVIRATAPAAQLHGKCDDYVTARADAIMADADFWNGPTGSRLRSRPTRTDAAPPSPRDDEDDAEHERAMATRRDAFTNHIARRNGAPERSDSQLRPFCAGAFSELADIHPSLAAQLEHSLPPVLSERADALVRDLLKAGMAPPIALRARFDAVMEERADKANPDRIRADAHRRHVAARRSAPAPAPAQRADLGADRDDAATPQRDPRADAHQQFMNTRNGGK